MKTLFNHSFYVKTLVKDLSLSEEEVKTYLKEAATSVKDILYFPITLNVTPTPASSVRVDPRSGRMYVPNKQKLIREIHDSIFASMKKEDFLSGRFPIFEETIVHIYCYFPTPKSFSKRETFLAEIKNIRPIVDPDYDNIIKIINDGIKYVLLYDDNQIVEGLVGKYYSRTPRVEVEIYTHTGERNTVHKKQIDLRIKKWKTRFLLKDEKEKVGMKRIRKFIHT